MAEIGRKERSTSEVAPGSADGRPVRVAHVVSHPIHYFTPVYRLLAKRREIDLTVYFLSDASLRPHTDPGFGVEVDWDVDLTTGYEYRIVKEAEGRPVRNGLLQVPHWRLLRELARGRYDVIWLHGYHHITLALAVLIGKASGARVMVREEQTLLEPRSRYKEVVKAVGLRVLFSGIDGLYLGQRSRSFFRRYGVPDGRLFWTPYNADTEDFERRAADIASRRDEVRRDLGIDDDAPAILFVGKLIQRKAPRELLAAFRALRRDQPCWLMFAGDGDQRAEMEEEITRLGIPNVLLLGVVNRSLLPAVYSAADVFVLPSPYSETWGVVVNEAMTFALPIVISDHVGSAVDLVRPGWNGFITRAGDVEDLEASLRKLIESDDLRAMLGQNSRSLVASYSVEAAADSLLAAILADPEVSRSGGGH